MALTVTFLAARSAAQKSGHVQEGRIVNAVKKCGTPNCNSRTSGHIDYATCAVVRYQVNCLANKAQGFNGFDVDRTGRSQSRRRALDE